ncbi:MAG: leucyl/phenylalanyl-tRNA--protein transferase [Gammaproteobacteria bacterium]|nr:leucyl/phenylalanyl-tRNA--protein transferase [Gammaproteobacteria bacterium]
MRFPPLRAARADGLLAVGGDLSEARLVAAYRRGIFPWYESGGPLLWWSPDPRCVLFPQRLKVSRSLARRLRRGDFDFTLDAAFARVISACAAPRAGKRGDGGGDGGGGDGGGTWLTADMMRAYTALHRRGIAHSAEAWRGGPGGELVGGLYGVALGGVFFGESMFSRESDASKVALARLVERLRAWGFVLIDCQVTSPHLLRLGAEEIARAEFIARLQAALKLPGKPGNWAGAAGTVTVAAGAAATDTVAVD